MSYIDTNNDSFNNTEFVSMLYLVDDDSDNKDRIEVLQEREIYPERSSSRERSAKEKLHFEKSKHKKRGRMYLIIINTQKKFSIIDICYSSFKNASSESEDYYKHKKSSFHNGPTSAF